MFLELFGATGCADARVIRHIPKTDAAAKKRSAELGDLFKRELGIRSAPL
jgi:hypothetical protein